MSRLTAFGRARLVVATASAVFLVAASSQGVLAGKKGAGNIDGKFGSHGTVLTAFTAPAAAPVAFPSRPTPHGSGSPSQSDVMSLGLQPSGKLIAMGFHQENGTSYYALARYIDGTLDPSFGSGGRVVFTAGNGSPQAMAIQSTGKIVVAGGLDLGTSGCEGDFFLARLTVDGAMDTTFGTNGQVTTDFGGCDFAGAIGLGAHDSIVATGCDSTGDLEVASYSATGSLISGFGSGTVKAAGLGCGQGVVVQSSGRIVVGAANDPGIFQVHGFTSSGALDPAFGTNGSTSTSFGTNSFATLALGAVALRSNGGIVLAGGNNDGNSFDIALAAYTANGQPDSAFGTNGIVLTDLTGPGFEDQAGGIAVQPDGNLVVGGWTCSLNCDFVLARYLGTTGVLDSTFGKGGFVTTDLSNGSGDLGRAVLVQPDGNIVEGGESDALTGADKFALVRYKG